MAILNQHQLELERCPHCNVDRPNLTNVTQAETKDHAGGNKRCWRFYRCIRCGGIVTAAARNWDQEVTQLYPSGKVVDGAIPDRARGYLSQALNSLSAPAGAVMLAASAVDAMLKVKGYRDGSLYSRIDRAVTDNVITADMGKWAHQVRLDANDQRHADESVPLPTSEEARLVVDFALSLAQFLFVLPARVQRGLAEAENR